MADQKVTIMVLKVDLQCCRCHRKIKKVLCKFLQIRDQVYDEKTNTIVIKVVCCSPGKIKQKIIYKAGDTLKSIEIKQPEKPKPTAPPEKPREKPKEPEKPKEKPKEPKKPPPKDPPRKNKDDLPKLQPIPLCYPPPAFGTCPSDCYFGTCPSDCYFGPCYHGYPEKPKEPEPKEKPKEPKKPPPRDPPRRNKDDLPRQSTAPAPALSKLQPIPLCYPPPAFGTCSSDCYHGNPGGPYYRGYDWPSSQCYQYDGYCGRPVYDSYGGGTSYTSENPGACSIM